MPADSRTPLWDAVQLHLSHKAYPFHVPGHKGGRGLREEFQKIMPQVDLTEVVGLDNLFSPQGAIASAEAQAAAFAHARATYFTTNGSSAGLIAAVLACCPRGSRLVLPQNAHLSLFHACVLGDLEPVFVPVQFDSRIGIPLGPSLSAYRQALSQEKVALAVLVHPTYHGVGQDVAAFAALCREFGVPLLVDEAHGTHLLLADRAPFSAVRQGADIVVQSVHKTGLALTGAAWVHVLSEEWREPVKEALRLVQSTSPSYLLLTSLDLARETLASNGACLYQAALNVAWRMRQLVPCFWLEQPWAQDPLRLVIDCTRLSISGYALEEHFLARGIVPEMAEPRAVTLVIGLYDRSEALARFEHALVGLKEVPAAPALPSTLPLPLCPQQLRPAVAYWGKRESISLVQALGRVAAAPVVPYPPGIPIIWPGQIFTEDCIKYIYSQKHMYSRASKTGLTEEVKVLIDESNV